MKILFICGCVTPGLSGVGDYSRILATACEAAGHQTALVGWSDPGAATSIDAQVLKAKNGPRMVRYSPSLDASSRMSELANLVREFQPGWISLQFVPYSFGKQGLVWPGFRPMADLLRSYPVHIMFHELWIGDYAGAPLKQALLGKIQKRMVGWLARRLQPRTMHTSNSLYRRQLGQVGVDASILPMFGTIEAGSKNADEWLFPLLQDRGIGIDSSNRDRFWLIGSFGSIHGSFPLSESVALLRDAACRQGKTLVLLSIGNPGPGLTLWETTTAQFAGSVAMENLGTDSATRISEYLNSLDVGLNTTPLDIIGKSSSAAAMLDHGLQVLVADHDASGSSLDDQPTRPGILTVKQYVESGVFLQPWNRVPRDSARDCSTLFIASLSSA